MFWAKKFKNGKKQTLKEHTGELLAGLNKLKNYYGNSLPDDENFWKALILAAIFHDFGKASAPFQSKIEGERAPYPEIPHNYLSPAFINRNFLREELGYTLAEALFYSIAFHHERKFEFELEDFKRALLEDLKEKEEKLEELFRELLTEISQEELRGAFKKIGQKEFKFLYSKLAQLLDYRNFYQKLIDEKFKGDKRVILLKGLLHRLDHSASAGITVEVEPHRERLKKLESYLIKRAADNNLTFNGFKPFQLKGRELSGVSVLVEAPTGSGKTEFALNWLNDAKGFYTLPVRTAVNAMHQRLKEAFETVGLLHGDRAAYYIALNLKEKEQDAEESSLSLALENLNLSSQLAFPLTVSTADQLFSSVFKYPGFEKIYVTLAYSKTVIDEPQGYTPKTLAAMVKGIEEVSELGGKFCVMSATLYPFVKEELKKLGFEEVETEELYESSPIKHRVKLLEDFDYSLISQAVKSGKKVLVVVNTVKKAVELYRELSVKSLPVRLLHSRFIQKDRVGLERQIFEEQKEGAPPVIWITTQVAEASLDVDFDILITEIAPLDALIQRMGRANRRGRVVSPERPNIFIVLKNSDERGRVYSRALVELAREGIENWDGKLVSELMKREAVNSFYTREKLSKKAPKFFREFQENLNLLKNGLQAESPAQAQSYFREVLTVPVIPRTIFDERQDEILSLVELLKDREVPFSQRLMAQTKLRGYMVNLYPNQIKVALPIYKDKRAVPVIVAQNVNYDKKLGVILEDGRDIGEFIS